MNPTKQATLKFTIFAGISENKRFFDAYSDIDIELNEWDYVEDDRHDFELPEEELQAKMEENAKDDSILNECLKRSLSDSDKMRFLRCLYRSEIEKDLINDAVHPELEKLTLDSWKEDCLIEVKRKYEEVHA